MMTLVEKIKVSRYAAALFFGLASGLTAFTHQSVLATETDWQENLGGKARAISSGPIDPETQSVSLAIQIELKKGWKTYWRSPGDSGIPPDFDFSKSSNLENIEILWPAPTSFTDDYGYSVGYKDRVTLPIRVTAKSRLLPVVIDVTMRYGVCERICVPVENQFSLVVTKSSRDNPESSALIDQATKAVPALTSVSGALGVTAVDHTKAASEKALLVTTKIAAPSEKVELFIEGPTGWFFSLPKKISQKNAGNHVQWRISLADLPSGTDISGKDVTFTLVNGKQAIEQIWNID